MYQKKKTKLFLLVSVYSSRAGLTGVSSLGVTGDGCSGPGLLLQGRQPTPPTLQYPGYPTTLDPSRKCTILCYSAANSRYCDPIVPCSAVVTPSIPPQVHRSYTVTFHQSPCWRVNENSCTNSSLPRRQHKPVIFCKGHIKKPNLSPSGLVP